MKGLQLHTAQGIGEKGAGFDFSRILGERLTKLLLGGGKDDSFVSKTLKAKVLSDTYFEIDVRTLSDQTLTLQADCDIGGHGILKTGSQITNISHEKKDLSTKVKGSAKYIHIITFSVGDQIFHMSSDDFKVVLTLCLKTTKTISLLCE